jgi:hypothetical protein
LVNGAPAVSVPQEEMSSPQSAANLKQSSAEAPEDLGSGPAVDPAKLPKSLQICETIDGETTERCRALVFRKGTEPGFVARRFDEQGVVITADERQGSTDDYLYRGKYEGTKIVGTFRVKYRNGGVMKGTWYTRDFQAPSGKAGAAFNVYVIYKGLVAVINSATHEAKTLTLPGNAQAADIAVSPDGSTAYVSTKDGPVYAIDGAKMAVVKTFNFRGTGMLFGFVGVALSPDEKTLYGSGRMTVPKLGVVTGVGVGAVDISSGSLTQAWKLDVQRRGSLEPGTMVFAGGKVYGIFGEILAAIDVSNGSTAATYEGHEEFLVVSRDGKRVYTPQIAIDTATGKADAVDFGEGTNNTGFALSPDGSTGYRSNGDTFCVIDMKAGGCGTHIEGVPLVQNGIAITPDGGTLFVSTGLGVSSIDIASKRVTDNIVLWDRISRQPHYPVRVTVQQPPYR